jgi:hypothetical protein
MMRLVSGTQNSGCHDGCVPVGVRWQGRECGNLAEQYVVAPFCQVRERHACSVSGGVEGSIVAELGGAVQEQHDTLYGRELVTASNNPGVAWGEV